MKPNIHNIKTKNWHITAHKKILEEAAFDRMIKKFTNDHSLGRNGVGYRLNNGLRENSKHNL